MSTRIAPGDTRITSERLAKMRAAVRDDVTVLSLLDLSDALDEIARLRDEDRRLKGTLRYLQTQARNGTLHPQVVIQNIQKVLGT